MIFEVSPILLFEVLLGPHTLKREVLGVADVLIRVRSTKMQGV